MTPQEPEILKAQQIRVFVDAHVHIHDCFDSQYFFDAAAKNFAFHSSRAVAARHHKYVLCLTETCGVDRFSELARQADADSTNITTTGSVWRFRRTGDDRCLIAYHPGFGEINIVAGRQIVTAERLEILAMGSLAKWEDGPAAADIVESVIGSGAIPVLPWGFGKWLGHRRRAVGSLIEKFGDGSLYLGDNSGRPRMLPDPAEFRVAKGSGMRILPGSDPLPFASECDRAGSFGFYADDVANREGVWTGLCSLLQRGEGNLQNYGSLESSLRFARNQIAMQYVTRVTNRRTAS
jgi:hypothetical protein